MALIVEFVNKSEGAPVSKYDVRVLITSKDSAGEVCFTEIARSHVKRHPRALG